MMGKLASMMPTDREPMGVSYVDLKNAVQEDLKAVMNALLKGGRIKYFKTLNGVTVYFDEKQKQL